MDKTKEKTQNKTIDYEDILNDNFYNLEKASMALNELLNTYEWNYTPDARKALEYSATVHPDKFCDDEAKRSWEYIVGYNKIMWLISVARDYCIIALESCENALNTNP